MSSTSNLRRAKFFHPRIGVTWQPESMTMPPLRANRDGFIRLYLRPRRLIDITRADLRTEIFGTVWDTPIGLSPVGNAKAFHPQGEVPVARAARAKSALQILSTTTNTSFEDIARPWDSRRGTSSIQRQIGTTPRNWYDGSNRQVVR